AGARQNSDVPGVTSPAGARSLSSGVPGVTPPAGARQDSSVPGVTPPAGARTPADSVPGVTLPTRPSAPAASGFADNSGRTPANWSAQTRGSQVPPLIVIGS